MSAQQPTRQLIKKALDRANSENSSLTPAQGAIRQAAVLCPLIGRNSGFQVILTRRSMALPTHAGQISFPGGKIDATDATPLDAALREAEEEIGLPSAKVDVLGQLDSHDTSTGFFVHPFVGLIDQPFLPRPEPAEVDEIFEVPMAFLLDSANHRSVEISRDGLTRRIYEINYRNYRIWGATAGMLRNFCEKIWAI